MTYDLNSAKIHLVTLDDWEGLYFNNELLMQGHRVSLILLLEDFFQERFSEEEIEDFDGDYLPARLEDLQRKDGE